MKYRWLALLVGASLYGAAIGAGHSWRLAAIGAVKFPLLLGVTMAVCALAYHLLALFLAPSLEFRQSMALAAGTYRDPAVLLASLAPISLFLGLTSTPAGERDLGEYPLVLGLNVLFIGMGGTVALVRRARRLATHHGLSRRRAAALLGAWLAVSLFAGGQAAWYLRPFFCPQSITEPALYEGTNPDYRGATNFYEAVYHLVDPPDLPADYYRLRR